MPGRDGIPSGPFGHLMCGDYLAHAPAALWHMAGVWWPLLVTLAIAVVVARLAWVWWRRRIWRQATADAVWVEVVPPVTATPAATLALWQLFATLLPAARRWTLCPRRLVWEVHATPTGMRAGLWIPPGVNPTAVVRALHRAWPGVRAEHATPPVIGGEYPAVGVALPSVQPDWLPLVDEPDPVPTPRFTSWPEADRIRAVFDGLAAAGRTGGGLLQVHVVRAPRHRVALLRRATVDPRRVRRQRGGVRLLILALEGLRAVLSGVLDLITPGPPATKTLPSRADPVVVEQARQARAKHGQAPHLLVAILAFATGPTLGAARAAAADITSGYTLLSPHWRPRRLGRAATAAGTRWVPERRMQLATVAETAALAALPAEPSAYGLPAAASRRVPPNRDTFTPGGPVVGRSRPLKQSHAWQRDCRQPGEDADSDDDRAPTAWSTP
ncbi:MAG: hypothetical protein ACRDQB_13520 [Thermocrispum sp.]